MIGHAQVPGSIRRGVGDNQILPLHPAEAAAQKGWGLPYWKCSQESGKLARRRQRPYQTVWSGSEKSSNHVLFNGVRCGTAEKDKGSPTQKADNLSYSATLEGPIETKPASSGELEKGKVG